MLQIHTGLWILSIVICQTLVSCFPTVDRYLTELPSAEPYWEMANDQPYAEFDPTSLIYQVEDPHASYIYSEHSYPWRNAYVTYETAKIRNSISSQQPSASTAINKQNFHSSESTIGNNYSPKCSTPLTDEDASYYLHVFNRPYIYLNDPYMQSHYFRDVSQYKGDKIYRSTGQAYTTSFRDNAFSSPSMENFYRQYTTQFSQSVQQNPLVQYQLPLQFISVPEPHLSIIVHKILIQQPTNHQFLLTRLDPQQVNIINPPLAYPSPSPSSLLKNPQQTIYNHFQTPIENSKFLQNFTTVNVKPVLPNTPVSNHIDIRGPHVQNRTGDVKNIQGPKMETNLISVNIDPITELRAAKDNIDRLRITDIPPAVILHKHQDAVSKQSASILYHKNIDKEKN